MICIEQMHERNQGKGFSFHSWDFVRGCAIGWCSLNDPHAEFDADESIFDYDEGPAQMKWLQDHEFYKK